MFTKYDLEQMLKLLDLSTLEKIDSKCRENNYAYCCPLSLYAPEALIEYASAIYRHILKPLSIADLTEEEYTAKWLAPYTSLLEQLANRADGFISTLRAIVARPELLPDPYIAPPPEKDLYVQISDFLDNYYDDDDAAEWDFFEGINDFLCNPLSPLRWHSVLDSRVPVLIAEVDALRDDYNKELIAFIGMQPTISDELHAIAYDLTIPKTKYGKELKQYRQLVEARLDYINLSPKDITLLITHKAHLPQKEWSIVEQALASETLSTKAKSTINKLKKLIKEAHKLSSKHPKLHEISKTRNFLSGEDYIIVEQLLKSTADWNLDANRILDLYKANSVSCMASPEYKALCDKVDIASHLVAHYISLKQQECVALKQYADLVKIKNPDSARQLLSSQSAIHTVTADIHKLFISSFASSVESEYSNLKPIGLFELEDVLEDVCEDTENDMFPNCNTTTEETTKKRQAILEILACNGHTTYWFDDYKDIFKSLSDCLSIVLNDLTPAPEALAHGAIVGMVSWCEQVKSKLIAVAEGNPIVFDYRALALDLRDKMQYHTLASNTVNYLKVTDTRLTIVEGASAEYIQDRVSSLTKPTDLLVHNVIYGIVKVCEPAPLPDVMPTSVEPQLPTAQYINRNFNKAEKYWVQIEGLRPDTMFTIFEEKTLTADEVKALKPVNDRTIQRLLPLFAGTQCTAYMLRDALYAHTVQGDYLKILPKYSPNEGYATYEFMAVNWNTLKSLINRYADLLRNTDSYDDILSTIIIRQTFDDSDSYGVSRKERLASRYRQYCKDVKFLYELKALAENIYKDTAKEALVYSLYKTFVATYYISQQYLAEWVHNTENYAQKLGQVRVDGEGDIIEYHIHHKNYDPRNNDPKNLEIHDKDTHDGLKRNCISVIYGGHTYPSISSYCALTSAGVYSKLEQALLKLQPGGTVNYKSRDYSIDADTNKITATDSKPTQQQGTQVDFNGTTYPTIPAFAAAVELTPDALRKRLSRAEADGLKEFVYKGLNFTVNGKNDITVTI